MADNKNQKQDKNPVSQVPITASLQEMLEQEKRGQLRFFPLAIGMLAVFVLVLYVIVQGHCIVDLPLFVILAAVAVWLMRDLYVKNQKLCDRISEALGEKR